MYNTSIVCVSGRAGTGKTTVADYLIDKEYVSVSFATPIKEVISQLFGWDMSILEGTSPEMRVLKETLVHPIFKITPRQAMQKVGAAFRSIREDFWIRTAEIRINDLIQQGKKVVIPDLRFNNEYNLLKSMNARMICLYTQDSDLIKDPKLDVSENEYIDFAHEMIMIKNKKDKTLFDEVEFLITPPKFI